MKKRKIQVLIELLRNSKMSDRELAKKLNTSQSTITRTRKRLEKRIIKTYTALPDFSKLNIRLSSVTFGKCNRSKRDIIECLEGLLNKHPRIIFTGEGEGMGRTCMVVSLHRDFADHVKFKGEFRSWCKGIKDASESFLIPSDSFQTFSLSKAVEDLVKQENRK